MVMIISVAVVVRPMAVAAATPMAAIGRNIQPAAPNKVVLQPEIPCRNFLEH